MKKKQYTFSDFICNLLYFINNNKSNLSNELTDIISFLILRFVFLLELIHHVNAV